VWLARDARGGETDERVRAFGGDEGVPREGVRPIEDRSLCIV